MTDLNARLDTIQARADAAMPGPWHWTGDYPDGHCPHAGGGWEDHGPDLRSAETYIANIGQPYQATYNKPVITSSGYDASSLQIEDEDAEFIAASRTDVPLLVAALRAVLDLHKPRKPIGTWIHPPHGYCPICTEGYAEWDGTVVTEVWPCPTVRAVAAALVSA